MTYYDKNALKLAHEYLKANVRKAATVVDATAGKGRDTLLLASLVGENGKVIAFDIQKDAPLGFGGNPASSSAKSKKAPKNRLKAPHRGWDSTQPRRSAHSGSQG